MNHDLGWQALIDCDTVPHTNLNDAKWGEICFWWMVLRSGGPNANYKANEAIPKPLFRHPEPDCNLTFKLFYRKWISCISDGPTVNHPLIGVYSGGTSGAPGIVQSTGTSLTFKFISDNSTQYAAGRLIFLALLSYPPIICRILL